MKKVFFLIIALFFCNLNVQSAEFLSGFDDIPLMDGLLENSDANLDFDTMDFKIIETYVESENILIKDFIKFYEEALTQLGFSKVSDIRVNDKRMLLFTREKEELMIDIISKKPFIARFMLSPK